MLYNSPDISNYRLSKDQQIQTKTTYGTCIFLNNTHKCL